MWPVQRNEECLLRLEERLRAGRRGSGEGGMKVDVGQIVKHCGSMLKDFGLYPEGKGKLLKDFKWGDDMTRITVWKDHSGCSVEDGLEVREPGARLND